MLHYIHDYVLVALDEFNSKNVYVGHLDPDRATYTDVKAKTTQL